MELVHVLKEFMLTQAVSGYEENMARKMHSYLGSFTKQIEVDRAGNVIATFPGTDKDAPSIMVFAHMDQLGFIVRKIEPNGLIQVDRLGGIPEKVLPGLEVTIRTIDNGAVQGVFGNKSHHATSADEKYKVDLVTSLFIDIGVKSKQEVIDLGVHVGCPVSYTPNFRQLQGTMVSGTAIDNRGACAVLVKLAESLATLKHPSTIYVVGTVWEEFSIRGAIFAARTKKPDLAIGLDVALPGDTPDLSSRYDIGLGKGPTVTLYNFHGRGTLNGTIAHNGLYKHALRSSEALDIPLQEFAALGMLTDCAYVQLEGNYIGCIDMGFPVRYTHSPVETCDLQDLENLTKIVVHMVQNIDKNFKIGRYCIE